MNVDWNIPERVIADQKAKLKIVMPTLSDDQLRELDAAAGRVYQDSEWQVCFAFVEVFDSIIPKQMHMCLSIAQIHDLVKEEICERSVREV